MRVVEEIHHQRMTVEGAITFDWIYLVDRIEEEEDDDDEKTDQLVQFWIALSQHKSKLIPLDRFWRMIPKYTEFQGLQLNTNMG